MLQVSGMIYFDLPNVNSNIVFNPYDNCAGINTDIINTINSLGPYDFFCLFFDDEVINLLIVETNGYAKDKLNGPDKSYSSRINK